MKSFVALALCIAFASEAYAQNWPSFRGQNGAGVGDGNALPIAWDAEKSINVLWKTPIPGLGHSSPVVWGERIFITTAVSSVANSQFVHGPTQTPASANDNSKHSFRVYCLDKNTGRVIWEKAIYEGVPKVKRHVKASYANPTPVTDGKKLIVSLVQKVSTVLTSRENFCGNRISVSSTAVGALVLTFTGASVVRPSSTSIW